MKTNTIETRLISSLRFPLIVSVVIIHAYYLNIDIENYPICYKISYFFSQCITRVAVPLFMLFSSYLLFYKTETYTKDIYIQKVKKRTHSLLIPYLIWNTLFLLVYFIIHTFFPELISGKNKLMTNYTITDWLNTYWNTKNINGTTDGTPCPINYPLWFIRDLFILVLFSPIIYWLTKQFKYIFICILGIINLCNLTPIMAGFNHEAIFYFSLGALFSIHKINFAEILKRKATLYSILFGITIILRIALEHTDITILSHNPISIFRLMVFVGTFATIAVVANIISRKDAKDITTLSRYSFFIYLYHALPLAFLLKIEVKCTILNNDIYLTILYFINIALITIVGIIAYRLLDKYCPRLTSILMGGR